MNEEDWIELMEEPAGGYNHGKRYSDSVDEDSGLSKNLGLDRYKDSYLEEIDPADYYYKGMVAHRGVLHTWEHDGDDARLHKETEYVDEELLEASVSKFLEEDLGEVRRIYGPGGLSSSDLEIRARMDEKFLQIFEAEGELLMLAKVLGFSVKSNRECRVMTKAMQRARKARG